MTMNWLEPNPFKDPEEGRRGWGGSPILIEYGVTENTNEIKGGYVPIIWVNGEPKGSNWHATGYDLDDAWYVAEREAEDEAGRWIGDWELTVKKRPGTKHDLKFAWMR